MENSAQETTIAIIGIDGVFPQSIDLEQFWHHLINGRELSTALTREALIKAGVNGKLINNPNYVPKTIKIDDVDCFDADFFCISPQMAKVFDPQNRKVLESVWHAIENAGYSPGKLGKNYNVGVFSGKDFSEYLLNKLIPDFLAGNIDSPQLLEIFTQNGQDFLANWIAYKLGFTGPVLNIQTACSTGLSALSVAYQNLQLNHCDVALVSAARLEIEGNGYLYQPGLMYSQDGICRPLDEKASGIVVGSAVVSVVLKRLPDALSDKDHIWGLIRGIGINNDGNQKQDFMAPGIVGQSKAINTAFTRSGLSPNDIDYVELHGTGTKLGDPVEITALKRIYGVDRENPLVLGSVKANIGHTSSCSGLSGLLKIVLSFKNNAIPPLANFEELNPHIKLNPSQFMVNKEVIPWPSNGIRPRRAALSSFGFGGTNVHVLLEEAPESEKEYSKCHQKNAIVFVSAKSEWQVNQLARQIKNFIISNKSMASAVAYTSLIGREHFEFRSACIIPDEDVLESILFSPPKAIVDEPGYCLFFTGQGGNFTQKMGRYLYHEFAAFRQAIDECKSILGVELSKNIWPKNADFWDLSKPSILQPAIFMFQYAKTKLWQSMGLSINCVIGHSIGEIAAACIAGALSLEEALTLSRIRGESFEIVPVGKGGMLVVFAEEESMPMLTNGLVIAAYNAKNILVISGAKGEIAQYSRQCADEGIASLTLNVTHSFHSPVLYDVACEFRKRLNHFNWEHIRTPQLPMYSTVTGGVLTTPPNIDYWIQHLLSPTLFDDALTTAMQDGVFNIALEIGPASALATLLKLKKIEFVAAPKESSDEISHFLNSVITLYQYGFVPKESGLYPKRLYKVPFPGYPFQKNSYWFNRDADAGMGDGDKNNASVLQQRPDESIDVASLTQENLLNLICIQWQKNLGCKKISADDDFFLLGGTSLVAIQIQADLRKSLNISIGMLEFMTSRTPRNLCHELWRILREGEKNV